MAKQHNTEREHRRQARQRRREKSGRGVGVKRPIVFVDGLPVAGCWVADSDAGLATVLIARHLSRESIVFSSFLIDRWGMGVKDCFARTVASRWELDAWIARARRNNIDLEPAELLYAQQLVWGGLEYGRANGFREPAGFHQASAMVGELPAGQMIPPNLFGHSGKPLIVGDLDSIMSRMEPERPDE